MRSFSCFLVLDFNSNARNVGNDLTVRLLNPDIIKEDLSACTSLGKDIPRFGIQVVSCAGSKFGLAFDTAGNIKRHYDVMGLEVKSGSIGTSTTDGGKLCLFHVHGTEFSTHGSYRRRQWFY